MKVKIGKKIDLTIPKENPFEQRLKCPNPECAYEVFAAVQIIDNKAEIAKSCPVSNPRMWPHDKLVMMLYICPSCSAAMVVWK